MRTFPFVDDRVHHLGVSSLRSLDAEGLENLLPDNLYLIEKGNEPLAVLMSFDTFQHIQRILRGELELAVPA